MDRLYDLITDLFIDQSKNTLNKNPQLLTSQQNQTNKFLITKLSMLKSLLTNTKHILITSTIALTTAYTYCSYRSNKNKTQYLQAINADTLKDASRLTNQSFGISWGFQADDTVMHGIDSGDLFFVKYDCLETLHPLQMIKCYKLTIPLLDEEYHAIGVAYRDESGLMAYLNQFGENKLIRYSQFVSLPYIKQLMVQKTKDNIHHKLVKLLQQDKAFQHLQHQPSQANKSPLQEIRQKLLQVIKPQQNTFAFINRALRKIGIVDEGQEIVDLRELLRNEKQVNIRTETNKMLRSL